MPLASSLMEKFLTSVLLRVECTSFKPRYIMNIGCIVILVIITAYNLKHVTSGNARFYFYILLSMLIISKTYFNLTDLS